MSILSKVTGIGINPLKGKIKIDPLKAIGTVTGLATGNPLALLGNVFGGNGGGGTSASPPLGGVLDHAGNTIYPDNGGGSSSILSMLGNVLGGGHGGEGASGSPSILNTLLQAGALGSGVYNTVKSNQARGKAVDLASNAYNADAPLRDAARQKLLHSTTPDLSDVYQNSQNPFSSRYRALGS